MKPRGVPAWVDYVSRDSIEMLGAGGRSHGTAGVGFGAKQQRVATIPSKGGAFTFTHSSQTYQPTHAHIDQPQARQLQAAEATKAAVDAAPGVDKMVVVAGAEGADKTVATPLEAQEFDKTNQHVG